MTNQDKVLEWSYIPRGEPDFPKLHIPSGYLYLHEAVSMVGELKFGSEWTSSCLTARSDGGCPYGEPPEDVSTFADNAGWAIPTLSGERLACDSLEAAKKLWFSERQTILASYHREQQEFVQRAVARTLLRTGLADGAVSAMVFQAGIAEDVPIKKYRWNRTGVGNVFFIRVGADVQFEDFGSYCCMSVQPFIPNRKQSFRGPIIVSEPELVRYLNTRQNGFDSKDNPEPEQSRRRLGRPPIKLYRDPKFLDLARTLCEQPGTKKVAVASQLCSTMPELNHGTVMKMLTPIWAGAEKMREKGKR